MVSLLFTSFLTLLVVMCKAHIPYFEPELLQPGCTDPTADWSFDNPYVVQQDAAKAYSPELIQSRSMNMLLGACGNDTYDVMQFVVKPGEKQYLVGLNAIVHACDYYADVYPAFALLGPTAAGDARFDSVDEAVAAAMPFDIPEGYDAIVRIPAEEEREVLDLGHDAYFIPYPLTTSCYWGGVDGFNNCSTGAGGATAMFHMNPAEDTPLAPGTYYIVVWDPDRTQPEGDGAFPRAIVLSFGYLEAGLGEQEQKVQTAVMTGKVFPKFAPCKKHEGGHGGGDAASAAAQYAQFSG